MANKHMRKRSIPYIIREMQNETTMRYHNIPIRIDKKEEENNTPALIQSTVCEDTK